MRLAVFLLACMTLTGCTTTRQAAEALKRRNSMRTFLLLLLLSTSAPAYAQMECQSGAILDNCPPTAGSDAEVIAKPDPLTGGFNGYTRDGVPDEHYKDGVLVPCQIGFHYAGLGSGCEYGE